MMKKNKLLLFTLLITVIITLVSARALAFAAGNTQTATLSVDPSTGIVEYPTYTINIIISEVTFLDIVIFRLDFNTGDDDFLEFASVDAGNLMAGADVSHATGSIDGTNYVTVIVDMPPGSPVNGSGSVATITFNLKETAEVGMTSDLGLPLTKASAAARPPEGTEKIEITNTYSGSVEVGLLITDLTIDMPATTKVNTPTTLSATLKDGVGNPIEGELVDFYIRSDTVWNLIGSDDTDAIGFASIDHAFTSVEEFDVKAELTGSTKYAPSSDTDTISVLSLETTLALNVPASAKVDTLTTISATLKDETDDLIEGEIVDFYVRSDVVWTKIGSDDTDASGIASLDYTFTSVGEFDVKAEFTGSAIYAPSSDTDTIQVTSIETSLTIDVPATTKVDAPTTLSAALKDEEASPIEGELIDFYIRSDTVWTKIGSDETDASGVASLDYAFTSVGELDVKAEFTGSAKYAPSSDTDSILVLSLGTTLTLDVPVSAKVDTPTTISATLKDETDDPVEGEIIDFYVRSDAVWTKIGSDDTDASGVASLDYAFTSVGEFDVKAEFTGSAIYDPSSDTATILVTWSESTLTLTVSPSTVKVDETITLSATLEDKDSGNPLHNHIIYFYIYADDEWKPIGDNSTSSDGVASLNYAPTAAGIFEVNATYWGSLEYTGSSDTDTIVVLSIETTLTLNVPATTKVNTPTTISATLKDETDDPVEGEIIDFYISSDADWTKIGSNETDASGVASISYTPTDAGTFQIKAVYDGSAKYAESSDTDVLTVSLLTTTLNLDAPTSARVEDTITLVATLKDENENLIEGELVDFYVRSDTVWTKIGSDETDASGVASIDYAFTGVGELDVKAEFTGSAIYAGSSDTATISVLSIETNLTIDVPATAKVDTPTTLSATLKDEEESLIEGEIIDFYIRSDTAWDKIGFASTDASGVASMDYTPAEAETFKLKAVYEGTQKYAGSSSGEVTLEVSAEEYPLSFLLDANLTILDVLFWAIIILCLSTLVFVYMRKIRKSSNIENKIIRRSKKTNRLLSVPESAHLLL